MQWNILNLVVASVLSTGFSLTGAEPETAKPEKAPLGMWVWQSGPVENADDRAELIEFCRHHGIDTLLVQIHFERGSRPPTLAFPDGLRDLLKQAAQQGIRVEALDGDPSMAEPAERGGTLARLDTVLDFHKSLPKGEGFSGIHYDIEPYSSERWRSGVDGARAVSKEMLETFAMLRDRVREETPDLKVAFDIPAWYDRRPELYLDFAGKTQNVQAHIQDLSDKVVIMSYRRKALGHNSVADISSTELDYAAKTGKRTGVALETIKLNDEPEITFYGVDPAKFRATLNELFSALKDHPGFGGVYLHHYDHLKKYLADSEPLRPSEP